MTAAHSPRLASWLLEHLAAGPHPESLVGDLDEQFVRGRSSLWYWRQVLSAILAGAARDLREHRLLAVRAALISWAIVVPWVESTWALYLWVSVKWANDWAATSWATESKIFFRVWELYGGGLTVLWCIGCAATGLTTARLHRAYRAAMLFVCVAAQVPLALWWGWPIWLRAYGLPATYSFPMRVVAVVILAGMPISTLVGGLLGVGDLRVKSRAR